jgi:hypothetical protein
LSAQQQAAQPKLAWPPTKEDLQRLYVDEKLSAAKIAKVYDHKTANPRSAAELILYYLRKYEIQLRNRVEELAKDTAAAVSEWAAKYPPGGEAVQQAAVLVPTGKRGATIALSGEERAVLELLRIPKLSVSHFDPETKGRVHAVMENLNLVRRVSLSNIARLIGNKTSGYVSYLFGELEIEPRPFEESRLKEITENLRKYERKPFDGTDEDKAYLLGVSHGDFHIMRPFGDAVRVSTGTTHPAMVELFEDLFVRYGHVSVYPRYKRDTNSYEWNIQVILDSSFEFLLQTREARRGWVEAKDSTMLAYLAGLLDAEGTIGFSPNPRTIGITVGIWNTDTGLLGFAYECLNKLGHRPIQPYLSGAPGGVSSGFHIPKRKAEWRVLVARFEEVQSLLRRLPLRHREKLARREIALSVAKGDPYEKVAESVSSLLKAIKKEVHEYTRQAELEYLRMHPGQNPRLQAVKEPAKEDDGHNDVATQDLLEQDHADDADCSEGGA